MRIIKFEIHNLALFPERCHKCRFLHSKNELYFCAAFESTITKTFQHLETKQGIPIRCMQCLEHEKEQNR